MDEVVYLNVHGLSARIEGDWPEVIQDLALDFDWFRDEPPARPRDIRPPPPRASPVLTVTVSRQPPDVAHLGPVPQAFITTRNTVFQSGAQTIVDYGGQVVAVYDRDRERLVVQGEDQHLVHEAAYLFLLSRVGRHLDSSGLTRIHALGLSGPQGAVLVLLPSGGGKTTLALRALTDPGVKLLSEDTPVLDRNAWVHPFPLRIGVNPADAHWLPDGQTRRIERLEYGPKLLLSIDTVRDRVEESPQPLRHIVVGRRWLNGGGSLTAVRRRALVGPLVRDGVVGVGVAQMIEYVLRTGARDFTRQGGVAAGRARCCARALARARAWQLELGRDAEQNWSALVPLLR